MAAGAVAGVAAGVIEQALSAHRHIRRVGLHRLAGAPSENRPQLLPAVQAPDRK